VVSKQVIIDCGGQATYNFRFTRLKMTNIDSDEYNRTALILNFAGFCLLFFLILLSPSKLLYDEPDHLAIAHGIKTIGLIDTLKHPPSISAPGPLYSFIHLGLAPLTCLNPPWIRLINIVLLAGVIIITVLLAQILNVSYPVLTASTLLVIPFLYPAVGMALTEIPALFFFTLFSWFCLKLMENPTELSLFSIISLSTFTGLLLCLARAANIPVHSACHASYHREGSQNLGVFYCGSNVCVHFIFMAFLDLGGIDPAEVKDRGYKYFSWHSVVWLFGNGDLVYLSQVDKD
jgi:hypothetical protein